jgi:hypothetical protein
MLIAKQFIMDKINTEGSLVVEEVPEGPSALVAISALGQLVEEGKLRIVQEPRRTVYMKNEP